MRARLPTRDSILKDYTREIADHMLKMACVVLMTEYHFGHDRLINFCSKMSELGEELSENPHRWARVDKELIDKRKLPFEHEDLDERELSAEIARRFK